MLHAVFVLALEPHLVDHLLDQRVSVETLGLVAIYAAFLTLMYK